MLEAVRLWILRRLLPGYTFHVHAWAGHAHENGHETHSHSAHLTTPSIPIKEG